MRKLITLFLCGIMVVSLGACSSKKSDDELSFDYGLAENGYYENVKALDYVTIPENFLDIDFSNIDVSDAIEQDVEWVRSNYGEKIGVDRPAELGDHVDITYVGTVDGVQFSGGTTSEDDPASIVLGSGTFIGDYEDQIVGHNIGDEFDVVVTFPDNYGTTTDMDGNTLELAGKEATFKTKLIDIYNLEITDAVVKKTFEDVGESFSDGTPVTTIDEMYRYFEEMETNSAKADIVHNHILNDLEMSELPDELIEIEKNRHKYLALLSMRAQGGLALDEYLQTVGYESWNQYVEAQSETMTSDATLGLLYQAIAEKFNIVPTEQELKDTFGDDLDKYVEQYSTRYLMQVVLQNDVIDYLINNEG